MKISFKNISLFWLHAFAIAMIFSCTDPAPQERKLAKVYGKVLYESDLSESTWEFMDSSDMETLKNLYIEHWIRNQLMLKKASFDREDRGVIKRMSDDYKNSLILDFYKERLIRDNLNSIIEEEELKEYYDMVKNKFRFDETMINLKFIRIAADNQTIGRIAQLWSKGEYSEISEMIYLNPDEAILADDVWLSIDGMKRLIPQSMILDETSYFDRKTINDTEFFLKVFDTKHKNDIIPFPLVRDKVEAMIISKRKNDLIDNYIADLYKTETQKNNIIIYE